MERPAELMSTLQRRRSEADRLHSTNHDAWATTELRAGSGACSAIDASSRSLDPLAHRCVLVGLCLQRGLVRRVWPVRRLGHVTMLGRDDMHVILVSCGLRGIAGVCCQHRRCSITGLARCGMTVGCRAEAGSGFGSAVLLGRQRRGTTQVSAVPGARTGGGRTPSRTMDAGS